MTTTTSTTPVAPAEPLPYVLGRNAGRADLAAGCWAELIGPAAEGDYALGYNHAGGLGPLKVAPADRWGPPTHRSPEMAMAS